MKKLLQAIMLISGLLLLISGCVMFILATTYSIKNNSFMLGAALFSIVFIVIGSTLVISYRLLTHKDWKQLLKEILYALSFWV